MNSNDKLNNKLPKYYFVTLLGIVLPYVLPYINISSFSAEQKYALGITISISSVFVFALFNYYRFNDLLIESYRIRNNLTIFEREILMYQDLYKLACKDNDSLRNENLELKKIIQSYHLNSRRR